MVVIVTKHALELIGRLKINLIQLCMFRKDFTFTVVAEIE